MAKVTTSGLVRGRHITNPLVLFESLSACLCGVLGVLTLVARDWIEFVFKVNPDRGSGALEWVIVASMFVTAATLSLDARRRWMAKRPSLAA